MNNHNTYNLTKPFKKGLNRTIIFLIVSMMGIGNAWADTWDGTITNNANNKFAENGITLQNPAQANSESNPYTIDNAKEFAYFMSIVKNKWTGYTSGYYWKLTTDIDLNNIEWTHGSNTGNSFQGHFDGGDHTVKNVSLPVTTNSNYGLFPTIQGANTTTLAEVKNLKINGVTFTSAASRANTTRLGSLAGYVKQAKVSDIAISNVKFIYTGGITNENDLGGAIGCAEATVSLESVSVSSVSADFTGTTTNLHVAGLVGKIKSLTSVNKCSTKDVTITYNTIANASRISGLIGYTQGAANAPISINGCSAVNTKINLKAGINNGSYIGALVAQAADNTQIGDGTDANKNIVTSPDINIGGDIMAASYIGGAIGNFAGATDATKTSVVKKLIVTSPKIKVNNYSVGTSLTGGVFGRVSTFTAVDGVNLTGTTFSFTKDLTVAQQIGTFAGTITGNATQQISVKNVTIDKSELTFGTDKNSNTLGLNAGVIGKVSSNVYLDSWKLIGNSNIIVNGDLNKSVIGSNGKETASDVRLGGFIGYTASAADAPIKIENIEIGGNSSIKITNHIAVKGAQLGGLLGYAELDNAANNQASMNKLEVKGTTSISVGGDISTTSYLGGFAGYIVGRALTDCYVKIDNVTLGISNITANGEVKAGSYFGGLLGKAVTACTLNDCKITTAANLKFSNDIAAVSYIGGAIGDFAGANGYTSYIKALTVKSPTISIKNYSAGTSLTGGVFGRVYTFTEVDGVTLTGASMTFTNDLSVAQQIGTFAGAITGNATQQISVKNVNINKSELTFGSSTTSNTAGLKAGIIGQVNNNVLLDTWKVADNVNIKVNGNLITSTNYIGGFAGSVTTDTNAPVSIENIEFKGTSTVSVSGDTKNTTHYLGGFISYLVSGDKTDTKVVIDNVKINGLTTVSIAGTIGNSQLKADNTTEYKGDVRVGGFAGLIQGSSKSNNAVEINTVTLGNVTITVSNNIIKGSYLGGLAGYITTSCKLTGCTIGSQALSVAGEVKEASYIGSVIGRLDGAALYPSSVTNMTMGASQITFGSEADPKDYAALRSGIIGHTQNNVTLQDWTIASSNVKVNGNLITSSNYIGCFAGYATTDLNAPVSIKNIELKGASTVSISGNTKNNTHYLGGFIGYLISGDKTDTKVNIDNVKINGQTTVSIAGTIGNSQLKADNTTEYKGDVRVGGFAGLIQGRSKLNNAVEINAVTLSNVSLTTLDNVVTGSYLGGFAGYITTSCSLTGCNVGNITLSVAGEVKATSYFGGTFARLDGAASYPSSVTNMTVGTSQITFSSESSPKDYVGLQAGVIGYLQNNVILEDWTVASSSVKVNGNLITSCSNIGGFTGYATTDLNASVSIKNIELKGASTVSISGNTKNNTHYLGGFIGYLISGDKTDTKVDIDNVKINGQTIVSIAGVIGKSQSKADNTIEYKGDVRIGGFAGQIQGRAQPNNSIVINAVTLTNVSLSAPGNIVTSSYFGGFAGQATTGCVFDNCGITSQSKLNIDGDINATSYIGGAFGNVTGATNYPTILKNITVEDMDISFGGNLSNTLYVGGIAGQLEAIATTPNKIENCTVSGKIRSNGNHTFKENATYAFGGIVGYTGQSDKNISEIRLCTSNVDFNLSGLTPATKTNLYCNGFVVGGIIGRIDTPSRLPEHLYYTGKIYAPYAAVAPIVGVFCTKIAAAAYLYDDYVGINAANLTPEEWLKANTWYYNNYKLGLSEDVIKQAARTKNYKISPIKEDGVNYLFIDDKVFDRPNAISGTAKNSSTVLAYNASGSDTDFGIYPAWNTNSTTYPSYYMYYMQGLNRGTYTPDEEVNFVMALMDNGVTYNPTLTRTGNDETGFVFTVSSGDLENNERFTITYQWYQSDKTTPIIGETDKTLSISKDALETCGNTIYCVVTVSGDGFNDISRTLQGVYNIVVFIDGTKGVDNIGTSRERGWTPETAVRTIDHANSLLANAENGGTWDKNIIVVMGTLNPNPTPHNKGTYIPFQSRGSNPATITGKWNNTDYEGKIILAQWNPNNSTDDKNTTQGSDENGANPVNSSTIKRGSNCYVLHDTKFENLTFEANGRNDDEGGGNNFIECHGNDVTFGKGLVMTGFQKLSKAHGNFNNTEVLPELTVILTATNLSENDIKKYTNRTKPQVVTFQSGHYGRLMGGRYTNEFFAKDTNTSHCILGSAKNPIWAVVNIEIGLDNPTTGIVHANKNDTGYKSMTWDGKYTRDINSVIAGLTDGSMYGDFTINFYGGSVSYIVGGNQGNPVANGNLSFQPYGGTDGNWGQWPNATYFGRSVINIEQKDDCKDINVGNLYTGGLGREANGNNAKSIVDMYYYGHTEVNVKSGTIGSVYAGGAGGVMGVNPWDAHLPYATSSADNPNAAIMNGVQYGDKRYGTWSNMVKGSNPMAKVKLHNLNDAGNEYNIVELDLSNSYTTVNISGGIINGDVYGGGYGFVQDMPADVTMQGVGSVFGTANINITGGNISGSVYGGSQGHSQFYNKKNKYGQTITHIAEMNGTVNLRISGTDAIWPTIGGNIYGGGAGVSTSGKQEYLRIATTGNNDLGNEFKTDYSSSINVIIDLPKSHPFTGNIYGGGQMGRVDGSTKVIINDGIIKGDIFGGGKGEIGHPDKAKVTGNTNVIVVDKK